MNWEGKTVWVTGASSGIGKAAATRWAEKGARVILSSRKEVGLNQVIDGWPEERRPRAYVLPLDLSKAAELPAKVAQALSWAGSIDALVHSDPPFWRPPWKSTAASWKWIISAHWL